MVLILAEGNQGMNDYGLPAKWNKARQAIAEADDIHEVIDIMDRVEAMRVYALQIKESQQVQNEIAEVKLEAQRKAGEFLDDMPKNQGEKGQFAGGDSLSPPEGAPTYAAMGIHKKSAARWQQVARFPADLFGAVILETKGKGEELTTALMLRAYRKWLSEIDQGDDPPPLGEGEYRTIVIDPPWKMEKIEREVRTNQVGFDYRTMSVDEIAAIKVGDFAADDCILFL